MIEKAFYAMNQSGAETELYATAKEAIQAGMKAMEPPFTVMQLIPNPVGQILTKRDLDKLDPPAWSHPIAMKDDFDNIMHPKG